MAISDSDVDFFRYGGVINLGTSTEDGVTTLSLLNFNSLFTRTGAGLESPDPNDDGRINIGESFTVSHPGGMLSAPVDQTLTLVGTGYHGTLLTGSVVMIGADTNGDYWLVFPNGDAPTLTGLVASTLTIRTVGYDPATGEPLCLCLGTRVETDQGAMPVEQIVPGVMVLTRDAGHQPVRWIGQQHLRTAELQAKPHLRPIRIRAGALGCGLPARDLLVSPQHRVLVQSKIARRMFEADEVLVAAKHLLEVPGVEIAEDRTEVTYFHLLFDDHQIIYSSGAATESLYSGCYALRCLTSAALRELLELFPELGQGDAAPRAARPIVPGRQGRKLAERHVRNHQPMQRRTAELMAAH